MWKYNRNFTLNTFVRKSAAIVLSASMVAVISMGAASAADYPSKPVKLIVPYKAGGSTETLARVFGKALGKALGNKVIVQTKPGGGGAVGATYVAKATADGYTLMLTTLTSVTFAPLTNKDIKYQTDSFRYIAAISQYQMAFVATPDKPYKSLKELIEYSKKPGMSLNVADQSGISRAFINYVAKKEGVDWTAIPTRGGGEMVPFLLGGKIDFAWSGGVHQKYGDKMHVLASCLSDRLALAPDAPSFKELYGISMPGEMIIAGPAALPEDIVDKIEAAVKVAVDDADLAKIFDKLKFPKHFIGSEEMKNVVSDAVTNVKGVIAVTSQ